MKNNHRLVYILFAVVLLWLMVLSIRNQNETQVNREEIINEYNVSGFSTDFTRVVEENASAVVSISAGNSILSGFVYRQEGDKVYLLTAYHGVADASSVTVHFGLSYEAEASIKGYDPFADLAVLEIQTPYQITVLKPGDTSKLKKGEFIISIGTPVSLDYANSVELGMVANPLLMIDNSITVDGERYSYYLHVVELSSNLKTGYSGSPVLNMAGEFVGMNTMSAANGFQFALSANEVCTIADMIINEQESKKTQFGMQGIFVSELSAYEKNNLGMKIDTISGFYIRRIRDNSLASAAGIHVGDILLSINNHPLDKFDDYLKLSYETNESYTFEVIRGDETLVLNLEEHD